LVDALESPVTLAFEQSKKVTGNSKNQNSQENNKQGNGSSIKTVMIGSVPDRGGRPGGENRSKAHIAASNAGRGRFNNNHHKGGRGGGRT
jgi:hypothetical protein